MYAYTKEQLEDLIREGGAEAEYQLALRYCILNNAKEAMRWLKAAAFKNHQKAIELIHELIEKKLIR